MCAATATTNGVTATAIDAGAQHRGRRSARRPFRSQHASDHPGRDRDRCKSRGRLTQGAGARLVVGVPTAPNARPEGPGAGPSCYSVALPDKPPSVAEASPVCLVSCGDHLPRARTAWRRRRRCWILSKRTTSIATWGFLNSRRPLSCVGPQCFIVGVRGRLTGAVRRVLIRRAILAWCFHRAIDHARPRFHVTFRGRFAGAVGCAWIAEGPSPAGQFCNRRCSLGQAWPCGLLGAARLGSRTLGRIDISLWLLSIHPRRMQHAH
jgi:hypothetical protein